jgi:serine protease AprX
MANCKNYIFFILFSFVASRHANAQFSKYIVQLTNKNGSTYNINNPTQFLSNKSIARRVANNISINSTDIPIPQIYINQIAAIPNVTILNTSKWFNTVCVQVANSAALNAINALPFVQATLAVAPRPSIVHNFINKLFNTPTTAVGIAMPLRPQQPNQLYNYGQAFNQIHLHNGDFLHNLGFVGNGMQIAIMDAGFQRYLNVPTFDSAIANNQLLGTWDFVANKPTVNEEHPHGMYCFSTIAANNPGTFIGTAPKASFYLFRTEDAAIEYPIEEQNFAAAAERADSAGVDVFSISLGYTQFNNAQFNYTYADMNGKKSTIAKACTMAANKGIAVIVAAGNEGGGVWKYITTPADADSVLTVGAIGLDKQPAYFSSYGPSSDGRIKPDVVALGSPAIIANVNTGLPLYGSGTSYATPIMAGITTCLWQAFPEVSNISIIDAVKKSADKYTQPNDRTGYGIADVKKAFVLLIKKLYKQQISINNTCKTLINYSVKAATGMQIIVERMLPSQQNYIAIDTQNIYGNFKINNITYIDDIHVIQPGITIHYRIKMNIGTDTSFYLDSATVFYLQNCTNGAIEKISITPNPVKNNATIAIIQNAPSLVTINMYNTIGQQVYQLNNQQAAAQQLFTIPMQALASGVYIVAIFKNGNKVHTQKMYKQ